MHRHVSGYRFCIDRDEMFLVYEFLTGSQSLLQGVILRVAELELVPFLEINRSSVSVEKFSGIGEDSFQKEIQVFHFADIVNHFRNGIQPFFCAQHDAFKTSYTDFG